MATIKTVDLIIKFQYAYDNKWGYIINKWHTMWTQEMQNSLVNTMKNKYGTNWTNNANAKKDTYYYGALYGSKWVGHWVTDCSGLFYWAFKELGGYMYHGSNTMWNKYCTAKGNLNNGKRSDGQTLKPGTAVFTLKNGNDRSHVGLYIGNGKVIEASGTQAGVIITEVSNKKWNEWGELKGVDYSTNNAPSPTPPSKQEEKTPEKVVGSAVVNDTKVALREYPSTKAAILTRIDKGERVQTLETEWTRISYMGKTGWMMKKFLNT